MENSDGCASPLSIAIPRSLSYPIEPVFSINLAIVAIEICWLLPIALHFIALIQWSMAMDAHHHCPTVAFAPNLSQWTCLVDKNSAMVAIISSWILPIGLNFITLIQWRTAMVALHHCQFLSHALSPTLLNPVLSINCRDCNLLVIANRQSK